MRCCRYPCWQNYRERARGIPLRIFHATRYHPLLTGILPLTGLQSYVHEDHKLDHIHEVGCPLRAHTWRSTFFTSVLCDPLRASLLNFARKPSKRCNALIISPAKAHSVPACQLIDRQRYFHPSPVGIEFRKRQVVSSTNLLFLFRQSRHPQALDMGLPQWEK